MKVCFIGLGSIAARHIKNLKEMRPNAIISVIRSGHGTAVGEEMGSYIDNLYYDNTGDVQSKNERIQSVLRSEDRVFDAVFVTNPTSLHYDTLCRYADMSRAFFIEKPVFMTGMEDLSPFDFNNNIYYVACPLRYTQVMRYIKNNIDIRDVLSARAISSSYLPEWRPGTDYRKSYSAHNALGGGVSRDLIHEWDYLYWLFGRPSDVRGIIARKSGLEIDSDDTAVYIAEYPHMILELHLDYYGRVPVRRLELITKKDTIIADLIRMEIMFLRERRTESLCEERDDYQKRELDHFFAIMKGQEQNDNGIEHACEVLRIARGKRI